MASMVEIEINTINKDLTWRLGLRENMTTGLLSRYYI